MGVESKLTKYIHVYTFIWIHNVVKIRAWPRTEILNEVSCFLCDTWNVLGT